MADETKRALEVTIKEAEHLAAKYPYNGNVPHCHDSATNGAFSFLCTRERGHDGPHIAWAPKGPIAMWGE